MPSTLLILYNASGTLLGHFTYGYHHLRQTLDRDCSACALTHGPALTLSARQEWVKGYLEKESLGLPCVLLDNGRLRTVFTKHELDGFEGDLSRFRGALEREFGRLFKLPPT